MSDEPKIRFSTMRGFNENGEEVTRQICGISVETRVTRHHHGGDGKTQAEALLNAARHWHGQLGPDNFQDRVARWLDACFGHQIAIDKVERNHRFLEEALELVQSTGCSKREAHQLVDYVFGRPAGEAKQEAGGAMMTLAALCLANGIEMMDAGEAELARVWQNIEKIRAKQAAKPKNSPLPEEPGDISGVDRDLIERLDAQNWTGVESTLFRLTLPQAMRLRGALASPAVPVPVSPEAGRAWLVETMKPLLTVMPTTTHIAEIGEEVLALYAKQLPNDGQRAAFQEALGRASDDMRARLEPDEVVAPPAAEAPGQEPDAWQHRIRVSQMVGGKVKVPFEWSDWTDWRDGKFGNPSLVGDNLQFQERGLYAAPPTSADAEAKFRIGDRVTKVKGSSWTGRVVGTYKTALTPEGYAVESETEIGSVQIYPAAALRSLASPAPPAPCPDCGGPTNGDGECLRDLAEQEADDLVEAKFRAALASPAPKGEA